MFIFLAAFNFGVLDYLRSPLSAESVVHSRSIKIFPEKLRKNSHENAWGYSVPCQKKKKNRLQHRFISCQFYKIFQKNFWRTSFIYVLKERCCKIVHQVNRRAPMLNMISISIAFWHECCPLNLRHIYGLWSAVFGLLLYAHRTVVGTDVERLWHEFEASVIFSKLVA